MGGPLPPSDQPAPRRRLSPAGAGALGGLIGGVLAGALGGAAAHCIEDLAPPAPDSILPNALAGGVVGGVVAAAAGALVGRLLGARRAAFWWPMVAAFWSVLVASVEVAQAGLGSGARAFLLGMVLLPALVAAWPRVWWALRKARWLLLGWLILCLVGEGYGRLWPKSVTPLSSTPDGPVAQLWYGPLPKPLNLSAVHYWLVTFDPAEGRWHRWDLWEYKDVRPPNWGHVHEDLMAPDAWPGGGPGRPEREWHGDEARAIRNVLARSPEYPYRNRYLAWPGPNSNTYIAWVLREAGVSADIDPRAIGRDYLGRVGIGWTTTRTGVQAESPVLGVKAGLKDGVELHFLTFTLGIDTWPPALKTPLGRVGFAE